MLNNLLIKRQKRIGYMGDHVAILESQYVWIVTMCLDLHSHKKVAKVMASLKNRSEYELLIFSISVLKEKETTCK